MCSKTEQKRLWQFRLLFLGFSFLAKTNTTNYSIMAKGSVNYSSKVGRGAVMDSERRGGTSFLCEQARGKFSRSHTRPVLIT